MGYIDAFRSRKDGKVWVSTRHDGKRVISKHNVDYHFYVTDDNGEHKNIYGDRVKKLSFTSESEFYTAKNQYSDNLCHESEFNPIFRVLEQNYGNVQEEVPHIAFFDIETDFDENKGYSSPEDAANPIISIALYLDWSDTSVCLAIPPNTMSFSECLEVANKFEDDHVIMFHSEEEMMLSFLDLIEDADVLSAWNGSGYDIPYVVHRIQRILGRNETHRLCLWHEKPRKRTVKQRTGAASFKEFTTYSLVGKTHLDYMEVYKNFTYESKHSYALDNIASEELDEKKIEYDGRLHELYRNNFEKFIVYNIKDTMLLYRLEQKLRYLELVFGIAWSNCVLPEQVLGTVRLMEQAVTLEAHKRGMILPDTLKKRGPDKKTVGGWVYGRAGVHDWVGSIDLTSLYPSIIRSLNMSPETTVGQISNDHTYEEINRWVGDIKSRGFTGWWTKDGGQFMTLEMEEYMNGSNKELKVEFDNEDGFKRMSARELKEVINGSDSLCVSANGTIFRTDVRGVIPSLLTRWFDERVAMKKKMNDIKNILDGKIKIPDDFLSDAAEKSKPKSVKNVYGFTLDSMEDTIQSGNRSELVSFLDEWGLIVQKNGVLKPKNKKVWESADKYWDKQQLIKKILLNSLYGGLLNEYFRFYDQRIGQSVTLTGRSITKHMTATANQIIMGEYDHLGEAVAYNDTDSVYMTIAPAVEQGVESLSTDNIIETYDVISNQVNDTFTDFMTTTFNAYPDYSKAIRCDREVVGKRMYVVTKKKYALLVIDDEGQRKDIDGELGKFKITGLDIRRSDTPKLVQDWLSNCLKILLSGGSYEDIETQIYKYAEEYRQLKPWQMGAPKSANGVSKYQKLVKQYMEDKANGYNPPKPPTPGHISGAFNWNKLIDIHNDKESDRLIDGMRIVFCYLKRNSFNMNRISYPSDQIQMPQWFVDLPFDVDEMFERNFVQKFYMLFRKSDIKLKFNTMDNVMTSSDLSNLFNKN